MRICIKEISLQSSIMSYLIKSESIKDKDLPKRIEISDFRQEDGSNVHFTLDDGCHYFTFDEVEMQYLINKIGNPITGRTHDREGTVYEEHYIIAPNKEIVNRLVKKAYDEQNINTGNKIPTFIWNARSEIWRRDGCVPERCLSSIVLDPKLMSTLKKDLDDFTSEDTSEWYKKHSIPFKRGYLFYGKPGTGKTSTISAIATFLKRKIYKLNLVAPGLCDNTLMEAVNTVKENSILVMEDIDSLFGVHRDKHENFSTTFSGLLNVIDGLGDPKGHIFIMTTNYHEKIDPALKRKGRIDLELEFNCCCKENSRLMFLKFYPGCEDEAEEFSSKIPNDCTPAQLQHHFIFHRKSSSKEACDVDTSIFSKEQDNYMTIYS